jgi:hypothetical protein
MSVIARRIISTPVRGAAETWTVITNLLAPSDSDGKRELARKLAMMQALGRNILRNFSNPF